MGGGGAWVGGSGGRRVMSEREWREEGYGWGGVEGGGYGWEGVEGGRVWVGGPEGNRGVGRQWKEEGYRGRSERRAVWV